jgi:hypothetical protein
MTAQKSSKKMSAPVSYFSKWQTHLLALSLLTNEFKPGHRVDFPLPAGGR